MNLKFKEIKIRIDFSFFVFMAVIFLINDSKTAYAYLTVCAVHEAAHAGVLCIMGGSLREIIFLGTGIKMLPEKYQLLPIRRELAVILAGPIVNIILFFISNLINSENFFALLNLAAVVFNLLPYSALDGGTALELLFGCCPQFAPVLNLVKIIPLILTATLAVMYGKYFIILFLVVLFYFLYEFKSDN